MPVSLTSAELPLTSTSSMSPPSACRKGRTRSSTASTRSRVIITRPRPGQRATVMPEGRRRKSSEAAGFRQTDSDTCGLFRSGVGISHVRWMSATPAAAFVTIRLCRSRAFELELFDAIPDLIPIETEERRSACLVPGASFERLHHERAFELLEIDALRGQFDALAQTRRRRHDRKLIGGQQLAVDEQHRPLHGVPQLANVAG